MSTDDLAADVDAMRRAGAKIGDPSPLTRDRPDGYHLSWVLAIPKPPFNGQVPFLIKDDTPRDERVPRERSHRNGATGIRTLAIAVNDPGIDQPLLCARARTPGRAGRTSRPRSCGRYVHDRSQRSAVARVENRKWPAGEWIRDARSICRSRSSSQMRAQSRPRSIQRFCKARA